MSNYNYDSIFDAALEAYERQTKNDLTSHPLLSRLQSCHSPHAILTALREQIVLPPSESSLARSQSQSGDGDGDHDRLSRWLVPTVNVLYAFSAALAGVVNIAVSFSPAKVIFAGIGVLLEAAASDVGGAGGGRAMLVEHFSRVEYFFNRLETYTTVPSTVAMTGIIVEIMVAMLSFLALATEELKRGQMAKYVRKLMRNKDVEHALRRLDRSTQEAARLAATELMKITHAVDGGVNGRIGRVNRNLLRDGLQTWLSPPNPYTNHRIACNAHHEGTSEWFLGDRLFSEWKSTGSLLWVHGKPGSGKSILCSAIIQDIISCEAGTALIAYFYFDFQDTRKQNLQNLLPSLLMQLSAQSGPCRDLLSRLYHAHYRGDRKPSDRAMIDCFEEMLTLQAHRPTYLIMDALDECPDSSGFPSSREEVLEFIVELVCLHFPNLHICVSSRPEMDIQVALEPLTLRPVCLHDESGHKKDIMTYVSDIVRSDRRMRTWREGEKGLVIKTLSEKANGVFRWVVCQLDVLRHCFPASVRRILKELPKGLDGTYERVLKDIRMANRTHAHRLLQCLVVAVRPLRVEELAEVLAFDFDVQGTPKLNPGWRCHWEDEEEAVLSACSSLVAIVDHGRSRVVQFAHFSVKEFLTSTRLAESERDVSRYHIRLQPAHLVLVRACIGELLQLDDDIDEDSVKNFPLARYAAEHWVGHARFGKVSLRIKEGMRRLFHSEKPHFAAWLWIHNPDRFGRTFGIRPGQPEARPLYYAARLGFHHVVKYLLFKYPGDANARGGWDGTPLHAALSEGHMEVSSLLVKNGADVNSQDLWHGTPLHYASKRGQAEIVRWLLDREADANARNVSGWTALHLAAIYGRAEIARMLCEQEVVVDARGNHGRTALHLASENERVEVVRVLLEHGADINALDDWGRKPGEVAPSRVYRVNRHKRLYD